VNDQLLLRPSDPGPLDPQEIARLNLLADYGVVPLGAPETVSQSDKVLLDLRGITELARVICGVEIAMVNLIDADHQHMLAAQGTDGGICDREDSMCALVFQEGRTVVIPDVSKEPRFASIPAFSGATDDLRFYAGASLVTDSGHSLGMLCLVDHEPRTLSTRQQDALQTLATQTVDVLELHRRTRLLDEANQQLTTSNTVLAEFAGRVSHDLQAPLSSITGFAEVLGDLPVVADNARASQFVQRIQAAGDRLRSTIDELLSYARVGAELTVRPVDLHALLLGVLDDLDAEVRTSAAQIDVEVGTVMADAGQLQALLQNLLTNAMKYRRQDVPCRIQVLSGTTADGWFLRVSDNGMGIPEHERERILQPMARLERDRDSAVAGTGIGLATVQRIAQAHHGRLDIAQTPGGGATITLSVPARA
jgi:signal transduction histidine kinase